MRAGERSSRASSAGATARSVCDALFHAGLSPERDASLCEHTTFRIGGQAEVLLSVTKPEQVVTVLEVARRFDVPVRCLGGGSNVLVSDDGVPGIVMINRVSNLAVEGEVVHAGGGYDWDALVEAMCERGLAGMSAMSGIPGSVGGAICGNAGAYGESVSDALVSVSVVNRDGTTATLAPDQLGLRYRHSRLKETGQIVVEATFALREDDRAQLREHRETILAARAAKHPPKSVGTAGSFFRNIEREADRRRLVKLLDLPDNGHRVAAGLLLDRVGARGMCVGGAEVFEKHANIIINRGGATARDVLELSRRMRTMVREAFAIELEREVIWIGASEPDAESIG